MGLLVIVAKAMIYNKGDHLPNWHPSITSLWMADKQLLLCPRLLHTMFFGGKGKNSNVSKRASRLNSLKKTNMVCVIGGIFELNGC